MVNPDRYSVYRVGDESREDTRGESREQVSESLSPLRHPIPQCALGRIIHGKLEASGNPDSDHLSRRAGVYASDTLLTNDALHQPLARDSLVLMAKGCYFTRGLKSRSHQSKRRGNESGGSAGQCPREPAQGGGSIPLWHNAEHLIQTRVEAESEAIQGDVEANVGCQSLRHKRNQTRLMAAGIDGDIQVESTL